jgi:hypothetical protein
LKNEKENQDHAIILKKVTFFQSLYRNFRLTSFPGFLS